MKKLICLIFKHDWSIDFDSFQWLSLKSLKKGSSVILSAVPNCVCLRCGRNRYE